MSTKQNDPTPQQIEACTKWLLELKVNRVFSVPAEKMQLIEICVENIEQSKKGMFEIGENRIKRNY